MNTLLGSQLTATDQQHVLASYVHRFTKDHRPAWAKDNRPSGAKYAVQFASDRDWLENTRFYTYKNGRLDRRATHCDSSPTWPDNPELRT